MPKINVAGIQDIKPEELLAPSRYTVSCVKAQEIARDKGDKSLALNYVVKAGITQPDGSSPEDRRLSDFFPLTGFEHMKDGGEFVKRKLASALEAFGVEIDSDNSFDYEDFLLKDADVITKNKENKSTGVKETVIQSYVRKA